MTDLGVDLDRLLELADLEAIKARREAAHAAVTDMCSGGRRWRMTIPVDPSRDHDIIITDALKDIDVLSSTVSELIRRLRAAEAGGLDPATIKRAAIAACLDHYDAQHLIQIPPCAAAVQDAEWWSAALRESSDA